MVEINLIPDVKHELLRAQLLRNWIIFISMIISGASIALIILSVIIIGGQKLLIEDNKGKFDARYKELTSNPSLKASVNLQNQLKEIQGIRESVPNTSRILGNLMPVFDAPADKAVNISTVNYDPSTQVISVEGETSKGYEAVESLQKDINATKLFYSEKTNQTCTVKKVESAEDGCISEDLVVQATPGAINVAVTESSYGENEAGQQTVRFSLNFKLNPNFLKFIVKTVSIKRPDRQDATDSKIQVPDGLFKAIEEKKENKNE